MTDFSNLILEAKKMQEKMKETQEALKKINLCQISQIYYHKLKKCKKK